MPKTAQKKYVIGVDSVKNIDLTEGQSYSYDLLENEIRSKGLDADKYVAWACDASGRFYWSHSIFKRYLKLKRFR